MRITVVILICLIYSCRNEGSNEKAPVKDTDKSWSNEHSVDFNQEVHNREEIDIKIYLSTIKASNDRNQYRFALSNSTKG